MKKNKITVYIVAITSLCLLFFIFLFNSDVMASKTGKVTATTLNVRTGAGSKYSVLTQNGKKVQLKKGTTVTIISEKSDWFYVSFTYNKKTLKGYVSKSYIGSIKNISSTPTNSGNNKSGTVNTSTLKVRKGAGTAYSQLTSGGTKVTLKKGAKVVIHSEKSGWYYITFTFNKKSLKGYVSKPYVTVDATSATTKPTTPSTSTSTEIKVAAKAREALKVRTSASTSASQLTYNKVKVTLKKSQTIYIRKETVKSGQKWYYVSFTYSGKTLYGWVSGDYVQLTLKSSVSGTVRPSSAQIYKNTTSKMTISGKSVKLAKNTGLTITKETISKGIRYYYVTFKYNNKTYKGYIKAYDVNFKATKSSTSTPTPTPTPTPKPTATPKPTQIPAPAPTTPAKVLSEAEFTKKMTEEGFPKDYITSLYAIHKKNPAWNFKAYKTGIKWDTAISKQTSTKGKGTVQSVAYNWISNMESAYDYVNDAPVITDNGGWVTASKTAVEYFMDPRNFLNETYIFMFEDLGYDKKAHTKQSVEALVKGTPLAGSFTYKDSDGKQVTMTYVDAIMDAANYSSVSPVHLAARIRQEVVTGANSFSGSASGKYKGYEGYYNFFNIGAYDSANPVANGLKYAKNGGNDATLNAKMFIPWDNPYKAIMGGAKFLGNNYIEKGQDTLYFQKFNVTSYSTHSHQYMTNIQAPYGEAKKTYTGYKGGQNSPNLLGAAFVFEIPVFTSMPSKVSIHPDKVSADMKKSFNNYLKDCVITAGDKTYISKDISGAGKFVYNKVAGVSATIDAEQIVVKPTRASTSALVTSIVATNKTSNKVQKVEQKTSTSNVTSATFKLEVGKTDVVITVQAANKTTKQYTYTITKK